jgi:type II secretory ATPase GspE/PulE/Tfp pilus assembly ATPase PilB-like protein
MITDEQKLRATLVETKAVDQKELDAAVEFAERENLSLSESLLQKDLISDENLGKLTADLLGFPFINLKGVAIPEETLKIIPEIVAKKQKVIAFERSSEGLKVAMGDPENLEIKEFIEKKVGDEVLPHFATERDITNALALYRPDIKEEFADIIASAEKQAEGLEKTEAPVRKIVETIIEYGYQNRASDIHIEPHDEESVIRFRVDGVLHDVAKISKAIHPQVATLIKVMARLRTDEHLAAQDGKITYELEGEDLDIRVSIVPITEGEKIVMRLLSERARQFDLESLGLLGEDFKKVNGAIEKPYGMILAVGPTGCGKTTTLYAILKILNQRDVNISTIEDPVEYDIEGVNQIQVNPKTELTFAKGLRSIVRQDPDIILVGEVRDEETASIAVNSAMTGHLVLSTLHTNDAATTLPRLLDMKIKPFLVSSTINIIIAQRLVRKICQKCRVSKELKVENGKLKGSNYQLSTINYQLLQKHFGDKEAIRIYHGKGCKVCQGTGYCGRVGIFEVLLMDDDIRQSVIEQKDSSTIQELAVKKGMTTMLDDGLQKVARGITTIEEVLRVVKT